MRRRRHSHRRGKNKSVRNIVLCSFALLFLLATGYSAFSTNITLNAKGNIKSYEQTLATTYIQNIKNNGDITLIDDGTNDHNIRYSGKDVNNYVCLESKKSCTEDSLYRIIGVFNNIKTAENGTRETRIKLIRATQLAKSMEFDTSNNNYWATPTSLNKYFNEEYYVNTLKSNSLLDSAVWHLSNFNNIFITANESYEMERKDSSIGISKIALFYPSDFAFASSLCYQSKKVYNEGNDDYSTNLCQGSNWLYLNNGNRYERTISPNTFWKNNSNINISSNGSFNINNAPNQTIYVRPSFYLKANVKIIENGNDGSKSKPYILDL